LRNNFSLSFPPKGKVGDDISLEGFPVLGRKFLADEDFSYHEVSGRAPGGAVTECWQLAQGYSSFFWGPSPGHLWDLNPAGHWYYQLVIQYLSGSGLQFLCTSHPYPFCCAVVKIFQRKAPGPVPRGAASARGPATAGTEHAAPRLSSTPQHHSYHRKTGASQDAPAMFVMLD